MATELHEGWPVTTLDELLTGEQAAEVLRLVNAHDTSGLLVYLESIGDDLASKGVYAAYLYHALCYKFGLG